MEVFFIWILSEERVSAFGQRKESPSLCLSYYSYSVASYLLDLQSNQLPKKSAENARKKLGGEVTLNLNMDKLMKDMEAGKQPKEAPPLKLENIEKVKDLEQVASYQYLVDASAAKVDKNPIKSEKKRW